MVAPVKITQSSVALKIPAVSELVEGGLAVNVIDGALYSARHDGSIIRIEGDTGNGSIASSASIALGGVMAGVVDVTGTTTITAIVLRDGQTRTVRFTGALTLTNSATLLLPGGANIVTVVGDYATFRGYAGGITRCANYTFQATNYVNLSSPQTLANKTFIAPVIDVINGTPIGQTVAAAGSFSTLTATSGSASTRGLTLVGAAPTQGSMRFGSSNDLYKMSGGPDYLGIVYEVPANGGHQFNGRITISGAFGCNGKSAQAAYTLGPAATDLATAIALVNNLRTAAINNGTGL